jgi:hypothetical protein
MARAWSRALGCLLLAAAVSGTALACSEHDASTNPDDQGNETRPAGRVAARGAPTQTDAQRTASPPAGPRDAGPAAVGDPPPAGGSGEQFHLDGADVEYEAAKHDARPRKSRPIELILRSTPSGAIAAVDGVAVGPTPAIWEGATDGRPRDFTFVLPGYAIARYRFIPMQSGVVHGTLGRLKSDADAGPVLP